MAKTTRNHRVTQHVLIDGWEPGPGSVARPGRQRGATNYSLTLGQIRIRTDRATANFFHVYDCIGRDGIPYHVAYARHLPNNAKPLYGAATAHIDFTHIYVITAEAVAAAFGLQAA